jgi:uncharacterized protein
MVDPLRSLRVNAVELLRQPGAIRDVAAVVVDAETLDAGHEHLDGEIRVSLQLKAMNDGIEVTGTVNAPWATVCRRCLVDVAGVAVGHVDELYQIEPLDPDAYLIEDGQLDLVPLVRETVLLELDLERQCRDDCAGLCPGCGIDRNVDSCECDTSVADDRWAALEGFVADDET